MNLNFLHIHRTEETNEITTSSTDLDSSLSTSQTAGLGSTLDFLRQSMSAKYETDLDYADTHLLMSTTTHHP